MDISLRDVDLAVSKDSFGSLSRWRTRQDGKAVVDFPFVRSAYEYYKMEGFTEAYLAVPDVCFEHDALAPRKKALETA